MEKFILINRKSQIWGMDLIIASVIFLIGIMVFYIFTLNYPHEGINMEALSKSGNTIMDSILSEGYPIGWNPDNVVKIGILSNEKINETKLENFYNLSNSNYQKTKSLFNAGYNYFFFLSDKMIINSGQIAGIGLEPSSYENLIKITRFTIYKDKPVTANLYVWE